MKSFIALFALILAFAYGELVKETVVLTEANFTPYLEEHKDQRVFIKFYAPWCGHCQKLAPTWEMLGSENDNEDVIYASVDCTESPSVCKAFDIKGYPTLNIVNVASGKYGEHRGGRDADALKSSAANTVLDTKLPKLPAPVIPVQKSLYASLVDTLVEDFSEIIKNRKNAAAVLVLMGGVIGYLFARLNPPKKTNVKGKQINKKLN